MTAMTAELFLGGDYPDVQDDAVNQRAPKSVEKNWLLR